MIDRAYGFAKLVMINIMDYWNDFAIFLKLKMVVSLTIFAEFILKF